MNIIPTVSFDSFFSVKECILKLQEKQPLLRKWMEEIQRKKTNSNLDWTSSQLFLVEKKSDVF